MNETLNIKGRYNIQIQNNDKSTDSKNEPYQDQQTTKYVSSLNLQTSLKEPLNINSLSTKSNNQNKSLNLTKNQSKWSFLQMNKIKFKHNKLRDDRNDNL